MPGILQVLGSVLLEGGPSSSASSAVMHVACTAIACLNNVAREDLDLLQVRQMRIRFCEHPVDDNATKSVD